MKTQISIQVKNENWLSKGDSLLGLLALLKKSTVNVYVDNAGMKPLILKARKEPYVLDVESGQHILLFEAKVRTSGSKMLAGLVGAGVGMAAGDLYTTVVGAKGATDFVAALEGSNQVKDNQLLCTLQEGDVLKISVQPKRNGVVKIKIL